MSDPYTKSQRAILSYLEEADVRYRVNEYAPPILVQQEVILKETNATGSDLFDLEVMKILTHDTRQGKTYYGFHPAIVGMPGDYGTTYTIDPDFVCDRCGNVQSSACVMGAC